MVQAFHAGIAVTAVDGSFWPDDVASSAVLELGQGETLATKAVNCKHGAEGCVERVGLQIVGHSWEESWVR